METILNVPVNEFWLGAIWLVGTLIALFAVFASWREDLEEDENCSTALLEHTPTTVVKLPTTK